MTGRRRLRAAVIVFLLTGSLASLITADWWAAALGWAGALALLTTDPPTTKGDD